MSRLPAPALARAARRPSPSDWRDDDAMTLAEYIADGGRP